MKYRLTKYSVSLVRDSSVMAEGSKRISCIADLPVDDMKLLDREQLRVYFLDARNSLIGWEVVSQGTVTASLAHPREILKGAILSNAVSIILAHNHPSGECSPSSEDDRLTRRMSEACQIMGIGLMDHVIVSENGRYSFQAAGKL